MDKKKPLRKLLVVDDVEYIQMMYRQAFADQDFEMQFAKYGEEALSIYESWHPDLIILDIKLPDMTGIQILAKIRSKDKETPVIMSTAFNMGELVRQAAVLGVSHFLAKPVDIDDLLSRIKKIFGDAAEELSDDDWEQEFARNLHELKQDTIRLLKLLIQEGDDEMLKLQIKAMLDDLNQLPENPHRSAFTDDADAASPLHDARERFALRGGRMRRTVRNYESHGKTDRVVQTLRNLLVTLDSFLGTIARVTAEE